MSGTAPDKVGGVIKNIPHSQKFVFREQEELSAQRGELNHFDRILCQELPGDRPTVFHMFE